MEFSFEFARSILPTLLQGAVITVIATFGGFAGALVGGGILSVFIRSNIAPLRIFAIGYIYCIRNTPLLVQLYLVFYVLPDMGITISALGCGILGLSLHYSTFFSEVYRAGIASVPRGQFEAADALGLHTTKKWMLIVVPQAIKPILPVLGNYLVGMFKETPLLAAITVVELFGKAQNIAGQTYRYNEPYLMVALIFLIISVPCSFIIRKFETNGNRH